MENCTVEHRRGDRSLLLGCVRLSLFVSRIAVAPFPTPAKSRVQCAFHYTPTCTVHSKVYGTITPELLQRIMVNELPGTPNTAPKLRTAIPYSTLFSPKSRS